MGEVKLTLHFKKFISNLSLNKGRKERINTALEIWEDILKEDDEFNEKYKDFYSQGSYATKTAIRPSEDGEFDVDVILLLDVKNEDSKEFFNWVKKRIQSKKKYKEKIEPKDRCVTINYSDEFHVDIVPAKSTNGDSIFIPSKKEGDWVKTNPKGFKKWCDKKHRESDEMFRPIVKIMKYWRDENVSNYSAPKSILLTTLIGQYIIPKESYAETLVFTLENIITNLDSLIEETKKDSPILISNPSLDSENLARDWTIEKCRSFNNKLKILHRDCLLAFEDSNRESSIEKWQEIFGSSKFPSELPDGAKMAAAAAAGTVYVSKEGTLNQSSQGTLLKEHRFFGAGS